MARIKAFAPASAKAILFDLSGTLVAWNEAYETALREAASEWVGRWSDSEEGRDGIESLIEAYREGRRAGRRRGAALRSALAVLPIEADERIVKHVARTARTLQPSRATLVPGGLEALERLHKTYRLAIVTNLDKERALEVWRTTGLARYVREEDVFAPFGKLRKPDRRWFRAIAARLDVPPRQCVMVGNSYRKDVSGAVKAGCQAIWVKKGARASAALRGSARRPLVRIPSLRLLPAALRTPTKWL
ncbi:HAD family hydrolase [Paenibacillus sp. TRM 82003]|nr:HAD family hydrolase [Paenibacillus sp. TRM 82003]